ncbi:MAG: DNA polymerase III subunit alpha [Chitinophagales bacterium]
MYLNCHSWFSLNYGVMSPEALLQYAQHAGITTLALTDINNTSGVLDFIRLAPRYNIKPVIGIDFRTNAQQHYIALAANNEGFRELNEHLSFYRTNHLEIPTLAPELPNCFVIYPWQRGITHQLEPNEYIGIKPADVPYFRLYGKNISPQKLVLLAPISFRNKHDFNTHRLLRAIHHNVVLSMLPPGEQGTEADCFGPLKDLQLLFSDFPTAIYNTERILEQCNVTFNFRSNKNKRRFTHSIQEDYRLLQQLAEEGLHYRYPNPGEQIRQRFNKEMETIIKQDFASYFLINWDIVRFATEQGFFHIGRGSGANSLVAYCLRITDVDPIELDLYFERFINPSRKNPPDFDIDFSHTDRDTVREYIFDKYGEHAALLGSYSTFEKKSCIREIGKVFGLPDREIDKLQEGGVRTQTSDQYGQLVLKYANRLHGLPNLLSVHACGIIISELPVTYYGALELMPVGFPSTQFSMLEAEDVGLYKFDILSQRGLGHIKDAVELIKTNRGEEIDIHRVQDFKVDPRINQLLKTGDTVGCFYVESPAMRQLLRKLEVEDYLGLVAASSVIRPGVASSGMMREYILRYRYPEHRKKAHPKLLEIMPDTYGVMVYQEDVIKVAHYYAGLTLEEADVMRRGMSGKYRSRAEFQQVRDTFFNNCKARNYPLEETAEIWRQIESFAGYSFAKGHSASYAVESYQSLFLRAYYPIEFMTGVLNNFGGFYSTEFYLHEARMLGADVQLPCVNNSVALAVLEGTTIYMGLGLIKDLEQKSIKHILEERQLNGPFAGLHDFINRVPISLEQLRILIRIKAFRFTGLSSKELLWEAHLLLGKAKKTEPRRELFGTPPEDSVTNLPGLEYNRFEDAIDEMKILGHPYTSPFTLLNKPYKNTVTAATLMEHLGKVVYITGYYVNIKRVQTIHGAIMYFGCFIDSAGRLFDTVHFPQSIDRYPFTGKGCYLLKGIVIEEFNVPSIDVSHMQRIDWAFGDHLFT